MSWLDRLQEAAYTAPSGDRFTFAYENVSREVDKNTPIFNFPGNTGTYVQSLGKSGRRYTLRMFIWGEDYDLVAARFFTLLEEDGVGILEHPAYGTIDVVPVGRITQRDNLKTAANQAIFDVEFFETVGIAYPTVTQIPENVAIQALSDYNTAVSFQLDENLNLDLPSSASIFKATFKRALDVTATTLRKIANANATVRNRFNSIEASINRSLDILIDTPIQLALQTLQLIQTPALITESITARIDAYKELLLTIITGDTAILEPDLTGNSNNEFYNNDLYAGAYISGILSSSINNEYQSQPEVISIVEEINVQFDAYIAWRDGNLESLDLIDTGEGYQQLLNAISVISGALIQQAFGLQQERRIILTEATTPLNLLSKLYGEIDEKFDFFIQTNNLVGTELLEIPKGRGIVYYV